MRALRADATLRGLPVPGGAESVKLSQYADDKMIYILDDRDAMALQLHLARYELASGARVNGSKSAALALGTSSSLDFPSLGIPFMTDADSQKYLGIRVGPAITDDHLWNDALSKLGRIFAAWSRRDLSIQGRLTVIRTMATSTLWFLASVAPPPDLTLSAVATMVGRYLWKGKKSGPLSREMCLTPRSKGGLGMLDVPSICKALQFRVLARLLDGSQANWKFFALDSLHHQRVLRFSVGSRVIVARPVPSRGYLDPFWHGLCSTGARLNLSEAPPSSAEDFERQHLFFNSLIARPDGAALASAAMVPTATSVYRVHHLVNIAPILYRTPMVRLLWSSVPVAWHPVLSAGPLPLEVGEWVLDRAAGKVLRIILVTQQLAKCTEHELDQQGVISSAHRLPRVICRVKSGYPRAIVATVRGRLQCFGSRARGELDMSTLTVEQGRRFEPKWLLDTTVAGTTAALTEHKAVPRDIRKHWASYVPSASRLFAWVWSQHRNRKVADFLWLLNPSPPRSR